MTAPSEANLKDHYDAHLKHLKLKGLQPKTIDAYARAIRRIGQYFEYRIEALSEQQLTDYFADLLDSYSWSAVKLDLYGLKFFYTHVLHKPSPCCTPIHAGSITTPMCTWWFPPPPSMRRNDCGGPRNPRVRNAICSIWLGGSP